MTTQEKIDLIAEEIKEAIGPITNRWGLDRIDTRTQVDIITLVHALNQVAGEYLDEIADGQFRMK